MTKAQYQTKVMEHARQNGCQCDYSEAQYAAGKWFHVKSCPSPQYENIPNIRIYEAMRVA